MEPITKQVIIKVISSPREIHENKISVACPLCLYAQPITEFDLTSEINETNCKKCRSLISVELMPTVKKNQRRKTMKAKKPTMRERFEFIYNYKFSSSQDYIDRLKPTTEVLLDKVDNLEAQHDKSLKALEDEIEGWKAANRILNAELEEYKAPQEPQRNIHQYFELTYAQYLAIPRSVLQSMPEEWQEKFVKLLDELKETEWFNLLPKDVDYKIELRKTSYEMDKFKWGIKINDPLADYERGRRNIFKEG